MSDRQESERQSYCRNCGAPVRQGSDFCVSCGVKLTPRDTPAGTLHTSSRQTRQRSPLLTHLGNQIEAMVQWVSNAFNLSNRSSFGELRSRVIGWFNGLSLVLKVLVVGSALLVLLVSLRSLILSVSLLLLGVSIVALAVQAVQRRSLRTWFFVAATSLGLALASGSVSGVMYGIGSLGNVGSSGGATVSTPSYEVVDSSGTEVPASGTYYRHLVVYVFASSLSEADLEWIAEDISPRLQEDYDSAVVMVWDEDLAFYDPSMPFGARVRTEDGGFLPNEANIQLSLSPVSMFTPRVPEGEYEISR